MTGLSERLTRLERTNGSQAERAAKHDADREEDAATLVANIEALAGRFDDDDLVIPLDQRLARMSPAQHCAWEIRFAARQTPVFEIIAMHEAFRSSGKVPGSVMENYHAYC